MVLYAAQKDSLFISDILYHGGTFAWGTGSAAGTAGACG
jgi:hypothetical protein